MLFHDFLVLHEHVAELPSLNINLNSNISILFILNTNLILTLLLGIEFSLHFLLAHFFGDFTALRITNAHDYISRLRFDRELTDMVHLYVL